MPQQAALTRVCALTHEGRCTNAVSTAELYVSFKLCTLGFYPVILFYPIHAGLFILRFQLELFISEMDSFYAVTYPDDDRLLMV